jgi:hypothetical protein
LPLGWQIMSQIEMIDVANVLGKIGRSLWAARLRDIRAGCTSSYAGKALARHHTLELLLDRMIRTGGNPASIAETQVRLLLDELRRLQATLTSEGLARLQSTFAHALTGPNTVVPLFHLLRVARTQRERGFTVHYAGLADAAPFDLLLCRGGIEAEIVCEVVSAEDGRDVHRGAWFNLVDRVDPELQNWLAAHPGRYLLKMTLPRGLKATTGGDGGQDTSSGKRDTGALANLHARITRLLAGSRRADHDEAAVLRLEPLLLAGAQARESGLMEGLRREFGPEAHLAITAAGSAVFAMAARAAREDEIAEAVQRRMAALAPARLTGTRPGILAMFVEDTDRLEWRTLRDQLRLEGAARHFLTRAEAKYVVAVTCASRLELFGAAPPDAAAAGRNAFPQPQSQAGRRLGPGSGDPLNIMSWRCAPQPTRRPRVTAACRGRSTARKDGGR